MKKIFKVTVTEPLIVLSRDIEANDEKEALRKLNEMKEKGEVSWRDNADIVVEEISTETEEKMPDADRNMTWVLNRVEQMVLARPEDISDIQQAFENSNKRHAEMSDLNYATELSKYIENYLYGPKGGRDKWNITGIAEAVVREMKEDGAFEDDELDYYIEEFAYKPIRKRVAEDAEEVAAKVRTRVENALHSRGD